jgi:hypothetical protein
MGLRFHAIVSCWANSTQPGYRGHVCVGVALPRFAGTCNEDVCETLLATAKLFLDAALPAAVAEMGRATLVACTSAIVTALAMVMVGSGDLRCLRLLRRLHGRTSPDVRPAE